MQTTLSLLIAHTAVHDVSAYTSAQHTKTKKAVWTPAAPPALPLLLPLPIPSLLRSIGFARIVLRVCVGAHTRSAHIPGKEQEAKRQRGKEAKRQRSKRQRGKEAK